MNNKFKSFFAIGNMNCEKIIMHLFYIGIILLLYQSYKISYYVYTTYTYEKEVTYEKNTEIFYTYVTTNNLILSIFTFIVSFFIILILWKLICEIIYKVIIYFTNNTK
ncbi:hypothetical protein SH1V18_18040 [Vallitalea longa]|uniref:Uncharacterized protein n=1 Tax=Vallitalea longa TaxID=2936439 RepID=A0A9W5YA17_9FIRM|nr:hypothetical protein SH1V18_18040 [Vallitalea longa]